MADTKTVATKVQTCFENLQHGSEMRVKGLYMYLLFQTQMTTEYERTRLVALSQAHRLQTICLKSKRA